MLKAHVSIAPINAESGKEEVKRSQFFCFSFEAAPALAIGDRLMELECANTPDMVPTIYIQLDHWSWSI